MCEWYINDLRLFASFKKKYLSTQSIIFIIATTILACYEHSFHFHIQEKNKEEILIITIKCS